MRTYTLRLTDEEVERLDALIAGIKGEEIPITPEAWLEVAAVAAIECAGSDDTYRSTMQDEAGDRMHEYINRPQDFGTLNGCTMRLLPWGEIPPNVLQTWFVEIGRTTGDFRAPGIEYQQAARVEISAKNLRLLRHLLTGHRHKFEYLVSEAFNTGIERALKDVQAEQWRELQRTKVVSLAEHNTSEGRA